MPPSIMRQRREANHARTSSVLLPIDSPAKRPPQTKKRSTSSMAASFLVKIAVLFATASLFVAHQLACSRALLKKDIIIQNEQQSAEELGVMSVIEAYQKLVANFVDIQIMSWNGHAGMLRDGRVPSATNQVVTNTTSSTQTKNHRSVVDEKQMVSKTRTTFTEDNATVLDGIIWDDEADIPTYFDQLMKRCSRSINAQTAANFTDTCWGLLNTLVNEPVCTVALDSRYRCSRMGLQHPINAAESMIRSHFTDKTINVMIVGAGPVGLYLANAPTEMSSSQFRVLVFENRVHSMGRKRPYSRDWLTDVTIKSIEGVCDTRIVKFFLELCNLSDRKVNLPIKAIETLLLLSNRDRGVKFLYDDYNKFESILTGVPNLVAFDATGHRLDRIKRVPTKHTVPFEPLVSGRSDIWAYVNEDEHKVLTKYQSEIQVVEHETSKGTILYPVMRDGNPYSVHFLKINDMRDAEDDTYGVLVGRPMMNNSTELCQKSCTNDEGDFWKCHLWCNLCLPWSMYDGYRHDIEEKMYTEHPGFSVYVMFISLSAEQFDVFSSVISTRCSVRFRDVPIEELARHPTVQQHNLAKVLTGLHHGAGSEFAVVDIFQFKPYMYKDPLVPGGLFGGKLPLLRIGDSLFNGDPNISTGLQHHVRVIKELIEQLR